MRTTGILLFISLLGCAAKGTSRIDEPSACPTAATIAGLYEAPAPTYDADRGECVAAARVFQRSARATKFRLTRASDDAFALTIDDDPEAAPATWTLDQNTCELVHAEADGRDLFITQAKPSGDRLALTYRFAPADGACSVSSRITAVKL